MSAHKLERFTRDGLGVGEVLQALEDILLEADCDDFAMTTARGMWVWKLRPPPAADENEGPE
jgi:hypothetical protein